MKKEEVLRAFIKEKQEKIQQLESALRKAEKEWEELPKVRSGDCDPERYRLQDQICSLREQLQRAQEGLQAVLVIPSMKQGQKISLGSLVTIKHCGNGESQIYLLISREGGCRIRLGEKEIVSISTQAPLAQAIINKTKGEKMFFLGQRYKIVEVG